MRPHQLFYALTTLFLTQSTHAQINFANFPRCLQECIGKFDAGCAQNDFRCDRSYADNTFSEANTCAGICGLSTGSDFLINIINCYKQSCDPNAQANPLIETLQPVCQIASAAIPSSIISSVESIYVIGVTTSDGGLVGVIPLATTTIIEYITDGSGQTRTVGVPEIYDSATTILGTPMILSSTNTLTPARPTPTPLGTPSVTEAATVVSSSLVVLTNSPETSSSIVVVSDSSGSAPTLTSSTPMGSTAIVIVNTATATTAVSSATSTGGSGAPFSSATKSAGTVLLLHASLLLIFLVIV